MGTGDGRWGQEAGIGRRLELKGAELAKVTLQAVWEGIWPSLRFGMNGAGCGALCGVPACPGRMVAGARGPADGVGELRSEPWLLPRSGPHSP